MEIDRRAFLASLGGTAVINRMPDEEKAEALEHYMTDLLDQQATGNELLVRRGSGDLFGSQPSGPQGPSAGPRPLKVLERMPEKPTLIDFFKYRFAPATHVLQSATDAMKKGEKEETILACLLHDVVLNLIKVDHGWWGAQMIEPYVSEKVSWAIRHHQALRFYPDESVGYSYPEQYIRIFGKDYVPEPYIKKTYDYARNHKWYMEARMITVHDLYAFQPDMKVSLDPFVDIIGRHFKQPKEGLGFDGSPTAHMWRSMIFPDHPL
jgi:predicted HD phosphohydrolase